MTKQTETQADAIALDCSTSVSSFCQYCQAKPCECGISLRFRKKADAAFIGDTVKLWRGDPIYWRASYCNDERNTYRVFHRDKPGRIVAEFYGDNAREMAFRFCQLFGEKMSESASVEREGEIWDSLNQ